MLSTDKDRHKTQAADLIYTILSYGFKSMRKNRKVCAHYVCIPVRAFVALAIQRGVVGWCDGDGYTSSAGASYLFGLQYGKGLLRLQ